WSPGLDVVPVAFARLIAWLLARCLLVALAFAFALALPFLLSQVGSVLEEHLQVVFHNQSLFVQAFDFGRRKTRVVKVAGVELERILEGLHRELALTVLQVGLGFLE